MKKELLNSAEIKSNTKLRKLIKEFLENLKNILLDYLKSRIFPDTVLMIILFFLLGRRLFILQIKKKAIKLISNLI